MTIEFKTKQLNEICGWIIEKQRKVITHCDLLSAIDSQLNKTERLVETNDNMHKYSLVMLQVLFYLRDGFENSALATEAIPIYRLFEDRETFLEKQADVTRAATKLYKGYADVFPKKEFMLDANSSLEDIETLQLALDGDAFSQVSLSENFKAQGNNAAAEYWLSLVSDEEKWEHLATLASQTVESVKSPITPLVSTPLFEFPDSDASLEKARRAIIGGEVMILSKLEILQAVDLHLPKVYALVEGNDPVYLASLIFLQGLFYLRDGIHTASRAAETIPAYKLPIDLVIFLEQQDQITESALKLYEEYLANLSKKPYLLPLDANHQEISLLQSALEGDRTAQLQLADLFTEKYKSEEAARYWKGEAAVNLQPEDDDYSPFNVVPSDANRMVSDDASLSRGEQALNLVRTVIIENLAIPITKSDVLTAIDCQLTKAEELILNNNPLYKFALVILQVLFYVRDGGPCTKSAATEAIPIYKLPIDRELFLEQQEEIANAAIDLFNSYSHYLPFVDEPVSVSKSVPAFKEIPGISVTSATDSLKKISKLIMNSSPENISKQEILYAVDAQLSMAEDLVEKEDPTYLSSLVLLQVLFYLRDGVVSTSLATLAIPVYKIKIDYEEYLERQVEITEAAKKLFFAYQNGESAKLLQKVADVPADPSLKQSVISEFSQLNGPVPNTSQADIDLHEVLKIILKNLENKLVKGAVLSAIDTQLTKAENLVEQNSMHYKQALVILQCLFYVRDGGVATTASATAAIPIYKLPIEQDQFLEIQPEITAVATEIFKSYTNFTPFVDAPVVRKTKRVNVKVSPAIVPPKAASSLEKIIQMIITATPVKFSKMELLAAIDLQLSKAEDLVDKQDPTHVSALVILQVLFYLRDGGSATSYYATEAIPIYKVHENYVEYLEKQEKISETAKALHFKLLSDNLIKSEVTFDRSQEETESLVDEDVSKKVIFASAKECLSDVMDIIFNKKAKAIHKRDLLSAIDAQYNRVDKFLENLDDLHALVLLQVLFYLRDGGIASAALATDAVPVYKVIGDYEMFLEKQTLISDAASQIFLNYVSSLEDKPLPIVEGKSRELFPSIVPKSIPAPVTLPSQKFCLEKVKSSISSKKTEELSKYELLSAIDQQLTVAKTFLVSGDEAEHTEALILLQVLFYLRDGEITNTALATEAMPAYKVKMMEYEKYLELQQSISQSAVKLLEIYDDETYKFEVLIVSKDPENADIPSNRNSLEDRFNLPKVNLDWNLEVSEDDVEKAKLQSKLAEEASLVGSQAENSGNALSDKIEKENANENIEVAEPTTAPSMTIIEDLNQETSGKVIRKEKVRNSSCFCF